MCIRDRDCGLEIGFLGTKTGLGRAPVPPMGAVVSGFSSVVSGLSTVDCGLEIGFFGAKTGLGRAPVPPMVAVASDFSSVVCGLSTVGAGVDAYCSMLSTGGCAAGFLGTKTGFGLAPIPPMGAVVFDFSSVISGLSTVDSVFKIGFLGTKTCLLYTSRCV